MPHGRSAPGPPAVPPDTPSLNRSPGAARPPADPPARQRQSTAPQAFSAARKAPAVELTVERAGRAGRRRRGSLHRRHLPDVHRAHRPLFDPLRTLAEPWRRLRLPQTDRHRPSQRRTPLAPPGSDGGHRTYWIDDAKQDLVALVLTQRPSTPRPGDGRLQGHRRRADALIPSRRHRRRGRGQEDAGAARRAAAHRATAGLASATVSRVVSSNQAPGSRRRPSSRSQ
jgi:hypothetical protein